MTDTERCHAEQARAAAYLAENPQGPEARGARQGLADWMAEEILLMDKKMERHKELAARYMREANGATWMDWIENLLLDAEARIAELTADESPRQAAERIVQSHLDDSTLTDEDLRNQITTAIQAASNAQLERGRKALEQATNNWQACEKHVEILKQGRDEIGQEIAELKKQLWEQRKLASAVDSWRQRALKSDHAGQVELFMAKFQQHIGEAPGFPPQEVLESKLQRVTEEFCELIAACGYKPHVQISDQDGEWVIEDEITAVCDTVQDLPHAVREAVDLEYSTHHLMISCGVDTAEPWARVHAANMAKELRFGRPEKPGNWVDPDIAGALREQGWGGAE